VAQKRARAARNKNRPPHSSDLQWWLTAREASLGIRSSLGPQLSVLELGCLPTRGYPSDPYDDRMVHCAARERRISRAWSGTPRWARLVLFAHYAAARPQWRPSRAHPPKVESRLTLLEWAPSPGEVLEVFDADAREGRDPKTQAAPASEGTWSRWPPGVEGRLGELAGVALLLAAQDGGLQSAIQACARGKAPEVERLEKRAMSLAWQAHESYWLSHESLDPDWSEVACG